MNPEARRGHRTAPHPGDWRGSVSKTRWKEARVGARHEVARAKVSGRVGPSWETPFSILS